MIQNLQDFMNAYIPPLKKKLSPPSVLVIEDDMNLKKTLYKILNRIDPAMQVKWLRSADDFFKLQGSRTKDTLDHYDLVLTDIYMPGSSTGFEIWNHFEQDRRRIPVVMMSGLSQYDFNKAMGGSTFVPTYLEKPFNLIESKALIEGLLRRRTGA